MSTTDFKLVFEKETNTLCRVVCYDMVNYCYIITPVDGGTGKWNDMEYAGVAPSEIIEATDAELANIFKSKLNKG